MTIEEIRRQRAELNAHITDARMRLAIFSSDVAMADNLRGWEEELNRLRSDECQHGARVGKFCPDCGHLLEDASQIDQVNQLMQQSQDTLAWMDARMEQGDESDTDSQ